MGIRGVTRAVGAAVLCIILFYALPNLIEFRAAAALGPWVCILFGDVLGSAALAVLNVKIGVGLYLALGSIEFVLLRIGVSTVTISYLTDLVPALLLASLAAIFAISADVIRQVDEKAERFIRS